MAFKLALSVYSSGLESQAAQALSALKLFATLTPPVTEADMRTELETGQFQAFSDEGWDNFLSVVGNTPLDETALTTAEIAITNTIRLAIDTSPQLRCCDNVVPADTDGLITIEGNYRTGSSGPWEYEIRLNLDPTLTCDIASVEVTFVGAPAITSSNPATFTFIGCDSLGNAEFSVAWVKFGSDPATASYDLTYDFLDSDGVSITSFAVTDYQLNL
jgi:hypothetical protein